MSKLGHKQTELHKTKLSLSNKGKHNRPHLESEKKKVSISLKNWWKQNRNTKIIKNRNRNISISLKKLYLDKNNHPLYKKVRPRYIVDKIRKANTGQKRSRDFCNRQSIKMKLYFINHP